MGKNSNVFRVVLVGLLMSLSLSVSAIPISGEIGMIGSFTPVDSTGGTSSLDTATGINFDPNSFRVTSSSTGDFASLAGDFGSIMDFQFVGFSGPLANFWTVDIFSFDLTSVNILNQTSQFLELSGTGSISATGFDTTQGTWSFSGNGTSGTFRWSGGSAAIPEPTTLALIGLGLIGFSMRGAALKRRRIDQV